MIDYEKLKIAHELAEKAHKGINHHARMNFYETRIVHQFEIVDYGEVVFCTSDSDELISKLQEFIKPEPEPKYKVGDEVWYPLNGRISCYVIKEIEHLVSGTTYFTNKDFFISQSANSIYPTREALIEAQIEYWQSLREPDIQSNQVEVDVNSCQHKPDGKFYYKWGDNELRVAHLSNHSPLHGYGTANFKCSKCGEFYR